MGLYEEYNKSVSRVGFKKRPLYKFAKLIYDESLRMVYTMEKYIAIESKDYNKKIFNLLKEHTFVFLYLLELNIFPQLGGEKTKKFILPIQGMLAYIITNNFYRASARDIQNKVFDYLFETYLHRVLEYAKLEVILVKNDYWSGNSVFSKFLKNLGIERNIAVEDLEVLFFKKIGIAVDEILRWAKKWRDKIEYVL